MYVSSQQKEGPVQRDPAVHHLRRLWRRVCVHPWWGFHGRFSPMMDRDRGDCWRHRRNCRMQTRAERITSVLPIPFWHGLRSQPTAKFALMVMSRAS